VGGADEDAGEVAHAGREGFAGDGVRAAGEVGDDRGDRFGEPPRLEGLAQSGREVFGHPGDGARCGEAHAPALLTTASMRPNASSAVCTIARPPSGVATVSELAIAVPPAASISRATSVAAAPSRSLTTTRAPSFASWRAWARPMPRPLPVTMTASPSKYVLATGPSCQS
jgi:hypothetical protein